MMVIIGIDIGMRGALAVVDQQAARSVEDLPLITTETDKRLNGLMLYGMLLPWSVSGRVVAEDIRPRPSDSRGHGNTMHSQGSLMRSRGIVEAVCDVLELRIEWVQPQSWKRAYGLLGSNKEASRQTALALMPEMAHLMARKRDEGRAEALLIARYGMQRFA